MWKLFFLLFLISCATPNSSNNVNNEVLNFDKNLTFEEFNILLTVYAKTSPYPNIEN
jgi:hypothetical protein